MGVTEILTIIFIVLKVLHKIDWSWFWVLFPEICGGVLYVVFVVVQIVTVHRIGKEIDKDINDFDKW